MAAATQAQTRQVPEKKVKISRNVFNALKANVELASAASREIDAALARRNAIQQANQNYIAAIVSDSPNYKLSDFSGFGLWEENGEFFIADAPPPPETSTLQ